MGGMQPNFEEFLRQRNPLEEVMLGGPRAQQITQFGGQDLSMLTPAFLQALLSGGGGGTQTLGFSPGGISAQSGPMSANQIIAQGQTSAAPVASPILAALSGTPVPVARGAIDMALQQLLGGGQRGPLIPTGPRGTQVQRGGQPIS